jgi:hypothetical protein
MDDCFDLPLSLCALPIRATHNRHPRTSRSRDRFRHRSPSHGSARARPACNTHSASSAESLFPLLADHAACKVPHTARSTWLVQCHFPAGRRQGSLTIHDFSPHPFTLIRASDCLPHWLHLWIVCRVVKAMNKLQPIDLQGSAIKARSLPTSMSNKVVIILLATLIVSAMTVWLGLLGWGMVEILRSIAAWTKTLWTTIF